MANFQEFLASKQTSMLNKSAKTITQNVSTMEVAPMVATMAVEPMALSLEDETIAAYSGDDFQRSDKYLWHDDYYDDDYSTIDNLKNVKISPNQVNLTQEENSQVIPFLMDRFYDGMDLMNMFIKIHIVNIDKDEGYFPPINVEYSSNKIRFYFLVPPEATVKAGKLDLEIVATGKNAMGNNYTWRTKPNSDINILQSLVGNGVIEPGQGWDSYLEIVNQSVLQAQTASSEAKSAAREANSAISVVDAKINAASDTITAQVMQDFSDELSNFYTKNETDTLINNIDISDQLEGVENRVTDIEKELETFQSDPTAEWVAAYDAKMDNKISSAVNPVQTDLESYKAETDADLQSIHDNIDNLPTTLQEDYYNKEATDSLLAGKADSATVNNLNTRVGAVETVANTNKDNIAVIGTKVASIEESVNDLNKSQQPSPAGTSP